MFKNFLKGHPLSDYSFSSNIFPSIEDRDFWESFQNDSCINEAEAELDYTWPIIKATDFMEFKKSGNRTIMENIHFDRRNHLVLFALAELKENKGRFIPQITNGVFAICEESFWGLSAHMPHHSYKVEDIPLPYDNYIDLFAAETAEQLSMVYKLLEKPLADFCPQILERIDYELDRRIRSVYLDRHDFGWMGYTNSRVNNWNPWILSNILTVFLLTENNRHKLLRALEKIFTEAQFYYNSLPADGGCDEGPHYWGRAGASLFEIVYQIKCATDGNIDLFDDGKLGFIAAYMKKAHMVADIFVNVADAHANGFANGLIMLFGFAKQLKQDDLMNFAAGAYRQRTNLSDPLSHKLRTMRRLVYNSVFLKEIDKYTSVYPLHGAVEYLPDMELAVLRNGEMTLSAKGGFNREHHNHNDVGSLSLYYGMSPILVDIGISTYTRFTFDKTTRYTMIPWTRSAYHNLPLINGIEQKYGAEYKADGFYVDENEINISFNKAYPNEADVDSLTRKLVLSDSTLTVTDRFVFSCKEHQKVSEALMSVIPVKIENNTAIVGDLFKISANTGIFKCEQVPFDDKNLPSDWKTDFASRITIDCENENEICIKVEKI